MVQDLENDSSMQFRQEEDDHETQTEEIPNIRIPARLRVCFGPTSNILSGFSVNLSSGGLFLETDFPLLMEEPLALEFEIPDYGKIIKCRGRVAWVNDPEEPMKSQFPPGMGIQFTDLTLENLEILRKFIKEKALQAKW